MTEVTPALADATAPAAAPAAPAVSSAPAPAAEQANGSPAAPAGAPVGAPLLAVPAQGSPPPLPAVPASAPVPPEFGSVSGTHAGVPFAPPVLPPQAMTEPGAPRRKLRAALRWTAAVLVFAAFGGAATYAVTQPERTRIPGLKTADDGRWTFPPHALPLLPAGKPRPLDDVANPGGHHFADVRSLLLPAPVMATVERTLPGKGGWVSNDAFLKLYSMDAPGAAGEAIQLKDDGLRHIAAEGWTMPDGTRTEIYLLQFISAPYRVAGSSGIVAERLKGVADQTVDTTVLPGSVPSVMTVNAYTEAKPQKGTTRYAYIQSGDVLALVVQSRGGAPAVEVPFRQTVRLQAQMLG